MIQIDPVVQTFLRNDDWFRIPLWVLGIVALPIPDTRLKDRSVHSDLQNIRKAGLRARVTRDPELFDDFYRNMYVPHATRTYGSSARVIPYDEMRGRLADSDLVLIHDGVRDIAGMMILFKGDRPRLWSTGVRDGDRRYVEQGALAALYHFSLQHLAERHFTTVSLGLSRTFLNDGVLRYKRKWGQRIIDTSRAKIALKIVADTPASRSFLQNHPFMFERPGELCGAVFLSDAVPVTAGEAARLKRQYFHDGLTKLILFSTRPVRTPNGVELPPRVTVEPLRRPGGRSGGCADDDENEVEE